MITLIERIENKKKELWERVMELDLEMNEITKQYPKNQDKYYDLYKIRNDIQEQWILLASLLNDQIADETNEKHKKWKP